MGRGHGRSHAGRRAPAEGQRADDDAYHRWTLTPVEARGHEIRIATKPGDPGHVGLEPATGLLLDHVEVDDGERMLDLHCGAGAVGLLARALAPAAYVEMYDRNLVAVEASRRTLAANAVHDVTVRFQALPSRDLEPFDVACIRLPLGRLPTLQLVWAAFGALRPGGRCYLAGANDEGVRTALRQVEDVFGGVEILGYRGGNRVGVAIRPEAPPDSARPLAIAWSDPDLFHRFGIGTPDGDFQILSRPGVFSWDRLDPGSAALMECMEIGPGENVLDLGCGYGIVGMAAARRSLSGRAVLLDVDVEAVRSATRSVAANGLQDRVEVIASDVAAGVMDRRFDVVVANPPFHLEKKTNLEIPARFIRDAAAVLSPGGRLYLVANRTLPYERWLRESFGGFEVARDGREFKVLSARRA